MTLDPDLFPRQKDPILSIRDLLVTRGNRFILKILEMDLFDGQIMAVIGPNGAGKSTLLLTIARLLRPSKGTIWFKGNALDTLSELEYRRKIALVLQEPLLFNTTVFNNVATGLHFRRYPQREVEERVNDWLSRMGIEHLRQYQASTLSGGQAQRTSLARALVLEPDLLLLDEPFSALDSPTRRKLMEELRSLLHETGLTTIFITHDQDEALFLGDRVAILLDGQLRQAGEPYKVFSNPGDPLVAEFVGVGNIINGKVRARENGRVLVDLNEVPFEAVGEFASGQEVLFCLRPEDITLWPVGNPTVSSARNRVVGQVTKLVVRGPVVHVTVECGIPLIALITRASAEDLELKEGSRVTVAFKASAVHLIPK